MPVPSSSDRPSAIGADRSDSDYRSYIKRLERKFEQENKARIFNEVRDAYSNLYAAELSGDPDAVFAVKERIDQIYDPHPPLQEPILAQSLFKNTAFPDLHPADRTTRALEKLSRMVGKTAPSESDLPIHELAGATPEQRAAIEANIAMDRLARQQGRRGTAAHQYGPTPLPEEPEIPIAPPLLRPTREFNVYTNRPKLGRVVPTASELEAEFLPGLYGEWGPPEPVKPRRIRERTPPRVRTEIIRTPAEDTKSAPHPGPKKSRTRLEYERYLIEQGVRRADIAKVPTRRLGELAVEFENKAREQSETLPPVPEIPGESVGQRTRSRREHEPQGQGIRVRKIYGRGIGGAAKRNRLRILRGEIGAGQNNPIVRAELRAARGRRGRR